MRTPLSRVRGLGSAKDGTGHFWYQRLTALANIPLIGFFIWQIISLNGEPYSVVIERLSSPLVAVIMLLVLVSGIIHMKMGMQIIIEDYVHAEGRKLALLIANTFFSIFIGTLCIFAIVKIAISV